MVTGPVFETVIRKVTNWPTGTYSDEFTTVLLTWSGELM